jgi:hypothetical protein
MPQTVAFECSLCHKKTLLEFEQSLCLSSAGPLLLRQEPQPTLADELRQRLPTSLPVGGIITPR